MNIKNRTDNDLKTICVKITYRGDKGDQLLKLLKAKLKIILLRRSSLELYSLCKSLVFTPT